MSMELSDKDKTLLYVVAALAILAASFFFGFRNFNDKKNEYKAQAQAYNEEYTRLIGLQKKKEAYKAMKTTYEEERIALLNKYEDGFNQENMIKTLNDIEVTTDVWVSELSFSESDVVYEFASEADTVGVVNRTSVAYESGYEELKSLLTELLKIRSKSTIESLSVGYDEANQICSGDLVLAHYSTANPESVGPQPVFNIDTGVANIFDSNFVSSNKNTQATNANYILSDYDASIVISPNGATIDSVVVGTTSDPKAKDSVSANKNETTEVTITFSGKEGKYYVSYAIGDKKYPAKKYEEGASFEPGKTLDLLVMSSKRNDNKDKVSVKANIINKTDMKLNVLVSGDDTESPRFSAASKEGDITIYR